MEELHAAHHSPGGFDVVASFPWNGNVIHWAQVEDHSDVVDWSTNNETVQLMQTTSIAWTRPCIPLCIANHMFIDHANSQND
jgi:hypothetical protein